MKKAKKFMATLTAVTVSAISLCSLFTANADSEMMKTYRVFHNVNSADNITYIDYVMNYSSSIIANPSNKTPLLNNGYFVSSNNDKIQGTYLGSAIQSGIAITTDFYTPNSVSNIFNEISYSATIRNSNNVNINPNSITLNAVLVGDVDQDGYVNSTDIVILNKYLTDPEKYPLVNEDAYLAANTKLDYDANGNPLLNNEDVQAITKSIAKWANKIYGYANKLSSVELPKAKRKKPDLLSEREQAVLQNYLFNRSDNTSLGILLSAFTGIRIGELCALKWNDIDLENKILHINKTVQRISAQSVTEKSKTVVNISAPKTEYSVRDIPIPEFLIEKLKSNYSSDEKYLLSGTCKLVEPRCLSYRFKSILKKVNLPSNNFCFLNFSTTSTLTSVYFLIEKKGII